MSNSYFQFKQFRVEQARCAMKVTTDACIQGAWTPVQQHVKNILDVGTGTGVLALMLAQRTAGTRIDAAELDKDAAAQAAENIAASPWRERVSVVCVDIRNYTPGKAYDLIVCNPPFFNNSLLGDNDSRNNARHTLSLSYDELLRVFSCCLGTNGYASVLLPADEYAIWRNVATEAGLQEVGKLPVKHTQSAAVKRVVGLFSKAGVRICDDQLLIIKEDGNYTKQFTELLGPFYLDL